MESIVTPCLTNSSLSNGTGSPFLCAMGNAMISSLKRPAFCAASALFCDATANSSCCWREIEYSFATFSAVVPM